MNDLKLLPTFMVNFGYPYNDLVICKDSTDYLSNTRNLISSDLRLVLVLVDYLAGLQEEHNAKVELSTTNYA